MRLTNLDLSFFSLFHHDVNSFQDGSIDSDDIYNMINQSPTKTIDDIYTVLVNLVENATKEVEDNEIALTLTGGFDSRIILAALLKLKRKPICFTYGDARNNDIKIAHEICQKFGLKFLHVVQQEPTIEWYDSWVNKTIQIGAGNVHLHRAHRTAAIAEFTKEFPVKVLFTGHFGGESIRGLSYNNYFSSSFFQNWNTEKLDLSGAIDSVLKTYFIKENRTEEIITELKKMNVGSSNKENRIFYFLYDLVANIHHAQDLQIYKSFVNEVVPIYMTQEFQTVLAQTPYHYTRKKGGNLNKLSDPALYCELLKQLEPKLLNIKLANGYKPSDFLNGKLFYLGKRVLIKYLKLNKNSPSFKYDQWYIDYVRSKASDLSSEVWEVYHKEAYFDALANTDHNTTEGYWHKFSNPIFFDLLLKAKLIQK
jgi:asparagine synthase (glutamine-hydrolysing)